MPENEQSVANLVRDALRDVQDLVRAENRAGPRGGS